MEIQCCKSQLQTVTKLRLLPGRQLKASGHDGEGVGKEGTEARDHPASPSLWMVCWDLLSQRLAWRGHTLPELGLGLNIKKTALWSGVKQEDPLQHAGRGASPHAGRPRSLGEPVCGLCLVLFQHSWDLSDAEQPAKSR